MERIGSWNHLKPGTGPSVWSEETLRTICSMLQDGVHVLDVVEKLTGKRDSHCPMYVLIQGILDGRNWTNISKEYNIDKRKVLDHPGGWDAEIADMVDKGFKMKEIIRHYGLTKRIDNPAKYDHIYRMIRRYKDFKEVNETDDIIVDVAGSEDQ